MRVITALAAIAFAFLSAIAFSQDDQIESLAWALLCIMMIRESTRNN